MRRALFALVLLAAALPAPVAHSEQLDPHATFLDQGTIVPPPRSRILDSVDQTAGCGDAPAGGRFTVDGDPSDWHTQATMIAGTGRYGSGEYVWTDYPYDDDGTGSFRYPGEGEALTAKDGTVGHASDREVRYGSNAADVTELRAAADERFLYVLVRLNFLNAVDTTVVGLAFDSDHDPATGAVAAWPHGAQMSTPGTDLFVTAYGRCGFVQQGTTDRGLDQAGGAIRVSTRDNTMELAIPRALLGGSGRIGLAAGAGLWDQAAKAWMVPSAAGQKTNSTDRPTGAATNSDPAVFNLLFRGDERTSEGPTNTDGASGTGNPRSFQTVHQHTALKTGTNGGYAVTLAMERLLPGGTSDPVPVRRGDELDFTRVVYSRVDTEGVLVNGNVTLFLGRWSPYGTHLPACYESRTCPWAGNGPPVGLMLHGGGGSHLSDAPRESVAAGGSDLYGVADFYRAMDAAPGALLIRPLGRGQRPPWWRGIGEADALEVLQDATTRYAADPVRRVIFGASLGGYGTLRLGSVYPDLWSAAINDCPAAFQNSVSANYTGNVDPSTQPFVVDPVMPNLLNIPYRQHSGVIDPLVPINTDRRLRDVALASRLDFRYVEYQLGSHCFDTAEGSYTWIPNHRTDATAALRRARETAPAEVRYVVDPRHYPAGPEPVGAFDIRDLGIVYEGAYWVSGLELRGSDLGSIDAISHAHDGWKIGTRSCGSGQGTGPTDGGDPNMLPRNPTPHTWLCQAQTRSGQSANALDVTATGLRAATVDLQGAGLDGDAALALTVQADGPLRLTLAHAGGPILDDGGCLAGAAADGARTTLELTPGKSACSLRLGARVLSSAEAGTHDSSTSGSAGAACGARAPRSAIAKRRLRLTRHRLDVRGRARRGRACDGAHPRVVTVLVAVYRRGAKRCRFVGLSGRLGKRRSCTRPVWLHARGTAAWRLRRRVRLPAGAYRIRTRALDVHGLAERTSTRSNHDRKRIR